jgi:NAD(P)-dependent dehydrogenase (short-subunit alcohol dehydrogenase family)
MIRLRGGAGIRTDPQSTGETMARLEGKVALITGAGSGIGLAAAELFAREGAKLVLAGRNEQALRAAVNRIGADRASAVVADVARPEDNERMVKASVERFGGLDVFLANAGVEGATATIEDYPVEAFDELMAINVRGVFLGLKYAIPALRKRGGGSIIVTSSIGGIKGRGQGNSGYIASKHAEIGLMRSAALEGAVHGIRVNAVLPGPIETRMMRSLEESRSPGAPEKARATLLANVPLKRYGTPAEVAQVMLFLASDDASLCTGAVYSADGGLSAS